MNTTRHAYSLQEYSAADALFDQIEQDLLALMTAPLDSRTGEPPQCVDEFADDFFSCWSALPETPGGAKERSGHSGLRN